MTVEEQIVEDALRCFPGECVGYISGGRYYTLDNISKNPKQQYSISLVDKFFLMRLHSQGSLKALVHSHPKMDNNPSEKDSEAQMATGYNFYIIGTDGTNTTEIRRIIHE